MVSACPACLVQVEHGDDALEVTCQCGHLFHPFMTEGDLPPMTDFNIGSDSGTPAGDYSASSALFQEIRDFGETLGGAEKPEVPAAKKTTNTGSAPKPKTTTAAPSVRTAEALDGSADVAAVSGEVLQGHSIDAYLAPISAGGEFDASASDPLRTVFDSLLSLAKSNGANGVVGIQWRITPDGSRCLVTGTPVVATKTS